MTYHQHNASQANTNGGAIYYLEDDSSVSAVINIVQDYIPTGGVVSQYSTLQTLSGNGALIYASVTNFLTLTIQNSNLQDNQAQNSGGLVYFDGSGSFKLVIDYCTASSNIANNGNGGAIATSSTINKATVIIQRSTLDLHSSKGDGGLLYLDGSGSKFLTLDSITLSNTKSISGNGGISSMRGKSSTVTIESLADPSTITSITTSQTQSSSKDGGGFHNIIQGGSCSLSVTGATISSSYTLGKGGLYYCSGSGSSSIMFANSQADSQKATGSGSYQKSGGGFYVQVSGQVTFTQQNSTITNQLADYQGGLAYLSGSSVNAYVLLKSSIQVSQGTQGGGAFYLQSTSSNGTCYLRVSASNVVTSSTNQQGGFLYASGYNATLQIDSGSKVSASIAQYAGGVAYLYGTAVNIIQVQDASTISGGQSNLDWGGIAYMRGLNNSVRILNGGIVSGCGAKKGAGCFYFGGTSLNEVQMISGANNAQSSISNVLLSSTAPSDLCNGGVFYMTGSLQILNFNQSSVSGVKTSGYGGIIYSQASASGSKLSFGDFDGALFSDFYAKKNGSFIYISGTNSPTFDLTFSNTQFTCSPTGGFGAVRDLWSVMDNLNYTNPSNGTGTPKLIGGLFYFQRNAVGTITSSGNTFEKCNTTTEGSVFYLHPQALLYDYQSTFRFNAGIRGQIFCDSCTAYFNSSTFYYIVAYQASLVWMRSISSPGANVTFDNATISHGYSVSNGGAVATDGSYQGIIRFLNCNLIQYFQAGGDGGFFEIDNQNLNMTYENTNWNHLYAYGMGGYIYGHTDISGSFSVMCKLGNITSAVDPGNVGPDTSGGQIISGCLIQCDSQVVTEADYRTRLSQAQTSFPIYSYFNKNVTIINNTFQNCLGQYGSIFKLVNSYLYDYGSTYLNNGGIYGGIAYCKNCYMYFQGSNFTGNFAQYGGIIYIDGNGYLMLKDVIITQSTAISKGGLVYAQGKTPLPSIPLYGSVEINIVQTAGGTVPVTFQNVNSYEDGGLIYLKSGTLTITDSAIMQVFASQDGGLIYTQDDVTVTIVRSNFTNITAARGGLMFSSGNLNNLPSTVQFTGPIQFQSIQALTAGGAFYFNNPMMSVNMTTYVYLNDSRVRNGNGGVFYLNQIQSIDFSPPTGTISLYTNFSVPHPNQGSFLYSVATGANISIKNCDISCTTNTPDFLMDISPQLVQQNIVPNYGGAIYVQNAFSVMTQNSNFHNCYQTNFGSIFYLKSVLTPGQPYYVTQLIDNGGTNYAYNQAQQGGVIFCDMCKLSLTGTKANPISMRYNYAQQGGVIFMTDTTASQITGVTFTSNQASFKGGLMSVSNPLSGTQGTIQISHCTVNNVSAFSGYQTGEGGAFHLDTVRISLFSLNAVTITDSTAELNGGIIFVGKMPGAISITASTFTDFSVNSDQLGSLLYSGTESAVSLTLSHSTFTCSSFYNPDLALLAVSTSTSKRAGAVYLDGSKQGVTSSYNMFRNCYQCLEGGAFFVTSSSLTDTGSVYQNMQALYGGVIKCSNCNFTIAGGNMDGSLALSGGAIMVENSASGLITSTTFIGTSALYFGGVMSLTMAGLSSPTPSNVTFRSCPNITSNSAKAGGVFYFNQPYITVILDRVVIMNPSATAGGVAKIDSGGGFIMLNSQIANVQALYASVLFSQSPNFKMVIANSTVVCNPDYSEDLVMGAFQSDEAQANEQNTFYLSGNEGTQISLSQSSFSQCGIQNDGGVFRLVGAINFTDFGSTFQYNSALEGGVLSCQGCNITLQGTKMTHNIARRGGAIKLEAQGNLTATLTEFQYNQGYEMAGVLFVTTQSVFNIVNSDFSYNVANTSSTIDALGSSSTLNNQITLCNFESNTAQRNTITLNQANAVISKSYFSNNVAVERTKNLFVGFATVTITDCTFRSPMSSNPARDVLKDQTMGAFIFVILDVKMLIQNTAFTNGLAQYGGAIYISGKSEITVESSLFSSNIANVDGGAIYGNGFTGITISKTTRFLNNLALGLGDDISVSNTEDTLMLSDVIITNPMARTSIYAEYVTLNLKNVHIQNINQNNESTSGAAIQCISCRRMTITNSLFVNLSSQVGGAIYLTDSTSNKRSTTADTNTKYVIQGSTFTNISANLGGGLYLDHPQSMIIKNCNFTNIRASNRTESLDSSQLQGIGGAIYFGCSIDDSQCKLTINGNTNFSNNFASVKGGAIHWNYCEPKITASVTFSGNYAGWYGDSISSYSQQLKAITKIEYVNQMSRIAFPTTIQDVSQQTSNQGGRQLQTLLQTTAPPAISNDSTGNMRSGSTIPEFYLAHVDKYGQIVAEFDSKIRVEINQTSYAKNQDTNTYRPILGGITQYISQGGVVDIGSLSFSGAPGFNYSLQFFSSGIDESLPENKQYLAAVKSSSINMNFAISLRECQIGEYFTAIGECVQCDSSQGFSLVAMTSPGSCVPCPSDKAACDGGSMIGPLPGFWRPSNSSSGFLTCPNPQACLGWVEPDFNPMGSCLEGYSGVLCAECDSGYSLTGLAKCSQCPDFTSNVVKLTGMVIAVIAVFAFMVRSTLLGAAQPKNNTSVYMKILMNHFQLILLVSSFNFQWPSQLQSFFKSTAPVSQASTQVISVDCFLQSNKASTPIGQENSNYFYSYFVKLLIFALLPILMGIVSYSVWWANQCIKKLSVFEGNKAISTLVISLFIIHPNIVQYMFNDFNCQDVDGTPRVQVDMAIVCYQKVHSFWSYSVAMPSIIVWGLGIPFFAFILMYKERRSLNSLETKEKFGFLYNGYQTDMFFWEIVIMYRKIAMIFISVFIQPEGVITQAMLVFLMMVIFLIVNLKKKPFVSLTLNDLETISLLTSAISIYCGVFFITDVSASDLAAMPQNVKSSISLSATMKMLFFLIIILANVLFFLYWLYKMLQEVKNTLVKKFEKLYLAVCLCNDRAKLEKMKNQQQVNEENEMLREQYFKAVGNLKQLYKSGKLVLTHQTLERALVYLNEERYMDQLGLTKREISIKDQKRFNRVTQGEVLKEMERNKHIYSKDVLDSKKKLKRETEGISIDEDYMTGKKLMAFSFYHEDHMAEQHRRANSFATDGILQTSASKANGPDNTSLCDPNQTLSTQHNLLEPPHKSQDILDPKERQQLNQARKQQTQNKPQTIRDETDDDEYGLYNAKEDKKRMKLLKDHHSMPGVKPKGANLDMMLKNGQIKVQQKNQAVINNGSKNRKQQNVVYNQRPMDRGRFREPTNPNMFASSVVKVQPMKSDPNMQAKTMMIDSDKIEKELGMKFYEDSDVEKEESDSIDAQIRGISHKEQGKQGNSDDGKNDADLLSNR